MYDRILVYVDRSNAFETYVPSLLEALGRVVAREAVLTTVVEPPELLELGYVSDPQAISQIKAIGVQQADALLKRIAARLADRGVTVRTEVLQGDLAATFRDYVARNAFDLLLIAPAGRHYLLTGRPRRFRQALHDIDRPVMILPRGPLPHAA